MSYPIPAWKVFVDYKEHQGTRDLYIIGVDKDGKRAVVNPFTLTTSPYGQIIQTPTLTETREETEDNLSPVQGVLQAMLDAAWNLGMRPKGYEPKTDNSAEIAAMRYHLEDMRLLAKVKK